MKSVGANDQQKLLSWLDKLGVHMSDQAFAMQHNLSHQSQWNTIRQARWQANVSHNANCHKGVQLTISMVTLTANCKWNSVYKQLTMYLIAISCDVMGLPIVASHAVIFLDLKGKHEKCTFDYFSHLQICTITHLHNCTIKHLHNCTNCRREKAIKKFPAAIAATFSWPQQVVLFVTFFYIWQSFPFSDSVCCKYTPAMGRIHRRVSADWFWSLLSLFFTISLSLFTRL